MQVDSTTSLHEDKHSALHDMLITTTPQLQHNSLHEGRQSSKQHTLCV